MDWRVTYREWTARNVAPGAVEMTQEEWGCCPLASVMLRFLYAYPNARKRRLFAVACLRRVAVSLPPRYLPFVNVVEDYAEGRVSAAKLREAHDCVGWIYDGDEDLLAEGETPPCDFDETLSEGTRRFVYGLYRALESPACYEHPDQWQLNDAAGWVAEGLADAASFVPEQRTWNEDKLWQERAAQADLLRDIYGDPFARVTVLPEWRGSDVMQLAQSMYDRDNFDHMLSLGETLRAAGCQDRVVLTHCESDRPHVRGCWLVDILLGKA